MKKYDHLWIIGNGFDIACKLKTGYYKFLDWYINTPNKFREKALEIKQNKKRSRFYKINHPLSEIFHEPMNINKDTLFSLDYYINNYDESVIKRFKNEIKNDNNNINWSDLELKLGQITNDQFINNSPERFGLCIDDLHLALNEYLLNEDKNALSQGGKLFENLSENALKTFDNIDIDNTVFIVLNYTKNFERFIRFRYPVKLPAIVYIHGTVYDDNTVLGIGSEFQIFNPIFAKNPKVTERLIKADITMGKNRIIYEDFKNFHDKNLNFTRNEVNIFGCSLGGSDMHFWYSFLEPYLQKGIGILHVYDIDKEDYCKLVNGKEIKIKCRYPKTARKNEIISNILFYYSSASDSTAIMKDIFINLISAMENYINKLEQQYIPNGKRMLDKYKEEKSDDNMQEYLDSIDKYLSDLEMKYGRIDAYAGEVDNHLKKIKEFTDLAEKSQYIVNQRKYETELDRIVSDKELNEFKDTLNTFLKTGKLDKHFLGIDPGIYQVEEEPLRTVLNQIARADDDNIKMVIAQDRGLPITDLTLKVTSHTYSYKELGEFANIYCECDIDKAIDKIEGMGENGKLILNKESKLTEVNPLFKETTRYAVKKIKKILVYHSLSNK